jgi:co-chaperonin GroES (HSP10)
MHLRPLGNNIIFQFLDTTVGKKGTFVDTHSIFVLPKTVNSQKVHRWGKVIAVGPKVEGVQVNDYILIEALMWMEGVKLNEAEKVWKTDDSKVLAVTNDLEACQSQAI